MLITETKIQTRYPDCDRMGVVHHAVYPVWYEMARIQWLEEAGFPFALSQQLHVNPAMVDLHLSYKAALTYPQTVTVRVIPELAAPKKLSLRYELRTEDGTVANEATSFHIWVGPDNRSYNLQENLPEVYEKLVKSAAGSTE